MPAPRGPLTKHERNLERNLDREPASATGRPSEPAASGRSIDPDDGGAKLARDAAEREAARRAGDRRGEPSSGS